MGSRISIDYAFLVIFQREMLESLIGGYFCKLKKLLVIFSISVVLRLYKRRDLVFLFEKTRGWGASHCIVHG